MTYYCNIKKTLLWPAKKKALEAVERELQQTQRDLEQKEAALAEKKKQAENKKADLEAKQVINDLVGFVFKKKLSECNECMKFIFFVSFEFIVCKAAAEAKERELANKKREAEEKEVICLNRHLVNLVERFVVVVMVFFVCVYDSVNCNASRKSSKQKSANSKQLFRLKKHFEFFQDSMKITSIICVLAGVGRGLPRSQCENG